MAVPFAIRDTVDGDAVVLSLAGEFDLTAVPSLRDRVGDLLARDAVHGIVVDLSAVTFLDSSGIGEFVRCRHAAADAGRWLRVVGAQGRVAAVLDLSGMTAHLAS